ncbi:MAG: DUF4159 domain-containing protein [Proteobacteria bacterium]|nr:DUF4159 domain-containing protein [Pseudomonadota bacterium]
MLTLGSIAFASPWVLAALAALPIIWLLLRVTPPAPKRLLFPAIRLLYLLRPKEETPARTPWWLILLRLTLAATVILALAQPLLNPGARLAGSGPLVLVIDDDWAAAPRWVDHRRALVDLIDQAEREGRPVALITTAAGAEEGRRSSGIISAADARAIAQALQPRPWLPDHAAAQAAIDRLVLPGPAHAAYLADGVAGGSAQNSLMERLQHLGGLALFTDRADVLPHLLQPPSGNGNDLVVTTLRAAAAGETQLKLRALAGDGRVLALEPARFGAEGLKAETKLALPTELRNQVARIELEGEASAGAVVLLDERWRRRPVGLVGGTAFDASQPLLDELHYIDRALSPFSEVRRGPLLELLKRELAVIVLPDSGALPPNERAQLDPWINNGGVLLRFAGPKLANGDDDLVPVRLRRGDRALGGALSWSRPANLAPFDASSPFATLVLPPDVTVSRQVLAQPVIDLNEKTWARLADGTPIVTAEKRGSGWVVLVHTTASPAWSNLPLSGLFVEMLRRLVALSQGVVGGSGTASLPAIETLDGFGRSEKPPATVAVLPADGQVGPTNPPGLYGTDTVRRTLNLAPSVPSLQAMPAPPDGVARVIYARAQEVDLKPWLLALALAILLADTVIGLALRGLLPGRAAGMRAASLALMLLLFGHGAALAQTRSQRGAGASPADIFALDATLRPRLAYVITGDGQLDDTSRAGLEGLTLVLSRRTALEPDQPMGVDVENDELAFFALIYWPMSAQQRLLSPQAVQRLDTYLHNGGTILFDTRDQAETVADPFGAGPGAQRLRELVRGLNMPALTPVPPDHVLTKAFYLLNEFPGRFVGGQVWVEPTRARGEDEVSSVIIGANDWGGAWAMDGRGRGILPVVPGGELQREMAYRFGVNLVMYALTGNYKADQVHVPAILERIGQ